MSIVGSTTIHPYSDTALRPIELGASVFVEANKNLWRATEEFNLTRYDFTNGDDDSKNGIWDGEKFRFVVSVRTPSYLATRVDSVLVDG